MEYKRYQFLNGDWMSEFHKWFPKITPISYLYKYSVPDTLEVHKGFFYILNQDGQEYLLGYAMESGTFHPYELYPWMDEAVLPVLYSIFKNVQFSRGDLFTRVWRRFKMLKQKPACLFEEGEDMKKVYIQWEHDRHALWMCFKYMDVSVSILVDREVAVVKAFGAAFVKEICIKLKLHPPTLASFQMHLENEYAHDVEVDEEAFNGILTFLHDEVRKAWM
jgi:hypothetical protein